MSAPEGSTARGIEEMAEALNARSLPSEEQRKSSEEAFRELRERVQFFTRAMHGVAGAVRDAMEPLGRMKQGLSSDAQGLHQQRQLNCGARELSHVERAVKRNQRKAQTKARKRHAKKK